MKILYNIHSSEEYLFSTYDKEKANKFVKTYNSHNSEKSDYYPDRVRIIQFKSSSDLDKTESKADEVISNYDYFYSITVTYNNQEDKFILDKKIKRYLNRDRIEDYESIVYNESGYRLTFLESRINESTEELIMKISNNYIINQSLIQKIKDIEQKLRNSLKGNILYIVYKKDYECPPRLFKTFSKEKAEQFVREYNRINIEDEEDRVGYFSINFTKIEEEADRVINDYLILKQIAYINVDKEGNFKLLSTELKYCGENIEDLFVNIEEQSFTVTIVLDKDYKIDLKDSLIIDKVKRLKDKFYFLF